MLLVSTGVLGMQVHFCESLLFSLDNPHNIFMSVFELFHSFLNVGSLPHLINHVLFALDSLLQLLNLLSQQDVVLISVDPV